jgi:serine protease inhibitor
VDLKQKLTAAGVTDIFNMDRANFSAISDTKLAVENVIHIAKIKVDCLSVFVVDCFP